MREHAHGEKGGDQDHDGDRHRDLASRRLLTQEAACSDEDRDQAETKFSKIGDRSIKTPYCLSTFLPLCQVFTRAERRHSNHLRKPDK